jgi:predicted lactoylglutathione lyase
MDPRITLITLGVRDLAGARAFYEALGFGTPLAPDGEVAFFQAGPMVFGLWTDLGGHGAPGIELAHNVASPEEVDAVLAEAVAAGGTLRRPAERMDWGGYSGAFADPEGYVWEVAHNPSWPLGTDGSVTLPGR